MSQTVAAACPRIVPHLLVRGAAEAIEFYRVAFGAEEVCRVRYPGEEGIMHAQIRIGEVDIYLCDESPQMERWVSPRSLNGTTVALQLWCSNADESFDRAVKAGAKVVLPLADMFWGDRYGRVTDPFGHEWAIAQHVRDVGPEEMTRAAAEIFGAESA